VRPGYKHTEAGLVPEDWEVCPVVQKGEVLTGKALAVKAPGKQRPYLRTRNVFDGRIEIDDVLTMPMTDEQFAHFALRHGDVLLNEGQSLELVGRCAMYQEEYPEPCAIQNQLIRFRARPTVCGVFASYLFRHCQQTGVFAQIALQTTSIAHLGGARFQRLLLAWPKSELEQRTIAAALSDVDALLAGLDQLIVKKRDLKQAAMQQLLTGKTRLPGFRGEWEVKRLGELAKIQRGASPRPIDSPVWFDDNSLIGWVRISDVTRSGMFLLETTQRLSPVGVQYSRPVATGSLIMSICATVGRPIITKIDVCIHDGFVVFNDLQADQLFLYYVLKWIEPDWSKHGQTGSQMNLNTGLITSTHISLPPLVEQTAIAEVLTDMDVELAALTQRREKTRALKQAMMKELLTGKVRLVAAITNVGPSPKTEKTATAKPAHNWQINEAVIIGVLAGQFGTEEWPLPRKRQVKLTYLLHRHVEGKADGYLKKAAGPYNPKTKYQGPEGIALKNRYIRRHNNGTYVGFVAAEKIAQAEQYFAGWYPEAKEWLEQFRFEKTDELELLATIDMAVEDLRSGSRAVELNSVKDVIRTHPEWQAKLSRPIFSNDNITRAINKCSNLFAS
jgi:type I restriction enzyme, S subunit